MSDYQPKVGDRVMVGEHGPYEVRVVDQLHKTAALLLKDDIDPVLVTVGTALWSWLTPAPEPEPDLPTAPGALVRDGKDDLLVLDADRDWMYLTGEYPGSYDSPPDIPRPITVILNDPAEVETLRAERDEACNEIDELDRRVKLALDVVEHPGYWSALSATRPKLRAILRGES